VRSDVREEDEKKVVICVARCLLTEEMFCIHLLGHFGDLLDRYHTSFNKMKTVIS